MPPTAVRLPNGCNLTATPVFGGLFFKAVDYSVHDNGFPAGWSIIIQTQELMDGQPVSHDGSSGTATPEKRRRIIHPFTKPTLCDDSLFISSISNPSSSDFKPATSPTRQIAMMLWSTLYWYFHQPAPATSLTTDQSKESLEAARPRGDWRIYIKREGVFRGRNLLQKLERMGLIASEDSTVGLNLDDRQGEGWKEMFVSQQSFWQLPGRLFLFTLPPAAGLLPSSPSSSRPASPVPGIQSPHKTTDSVDSNHRTTLSPGLWAPHTPGPFSSGSHLPTYFPPPPLQYTVTEGIRHPIRPKPPQQGEIFYTRFVPSVGQYLSFRTASLSPQPVAHLGPVSSTPNVFIRSSHLASAASYSPASGPGSESGTSSTADARITNDDDICSMTDLQLLHRWFNNPRVSKAWGSSGDIGVQEELLKKALTNKHSYPVIGYWDDKPFGFMEIYWAKEDHLARYAEGHIGDWDRGLHVLVGEEEFRGKARLGAWLLGLVHALLISDYRTESILLEPRVDNEKFISLLQEFGFRRERDVTFPHKQAAFIRFSRADFQSPIL